MIKIHPVLAVADARRKIAEMKPGETFCYHLGSLMEDRRGDGRIRRLAEFMLHQACPAQYPYGHDIVVNGLDAGSLTQRRLGRNFFEYLFTKGNAS